MRLIANISVFLLQLSVVDVGKRGADGVNEEVEHVGRERLVFVLVLVIFAEREAEVDLTRPFDNGLHTVQCQLLIELCHCVGVAGDKLVYQLCVDEGNRRRERADVRPSVLR